MGKGYDHDKDYPITDNDDWYFSIHGSSSDGFAIHWYRKIGWGSVTSGLKDETMSLSELIEFLANPKNHTYPRSKNG